MENNYLEIMEVHYLQVSRSWMNAIQIHLVAESDESYFGSGSTRRITRKASQNDLHILTQRPNQSWLNVALGNIEDKHNGRWFR